MKQRITVYLILLNGIYINASNDYELSIDHSNKTVSITMKLDEISLVPLAGPWSNKEIVINFLAVCYLTMHYYQLIQKGKNLPITSHFEATQLIVTPFVGAYLMLQAVRWYFHLLNTPTMTLQEFLRNNANTSKTESKQLDCERICTKDTSE